MNLLSLHFAMKELDWWPCTIYRHGCHLGHVTLTIYTILIPEMAPHEILVSNGQAVCDFRKWSVNNAG